MSLCLFAKLILPDQTFQDVIERIYCQYEEQKIHQWTHTIPNAMIATVGLLYGEDDYERSVCLTVQSAFDTDCNGGTIGSIVGMMSGINAIPDNWLQPLHVTLETNISGMGKIDIDALDSVVNKGATKWQYNGFGRRRRKKQDF